MLGEIDANLGKLKISILLTIKSLVELGSNQRPFGLTIESDLVCQERTLKIIILLGLLR
jgi:hypothetical protein